MLQTRSLCSQLQHEGLPCRQDNRRLVTPAEEFVDGLPLTPAGRESVLVKEHHPARQHPLIEVFAGIMRGPVEVDIHVHQRPVRIRKLAKGIRNPSLVHVHTVPRFAQERGNSAHVREPEIPFTIEQVTLRIGFRQSIETVHEVQLILCLLGHPRHQQGRAPAEDTAFCERSCESRRVPTQSRQVVQPRPLVKGQDLDILDVLAEIGGVPPRRIQRPIPGPGLIAIPVGHQPCVPALWITARRGPVFRRYHARVFLCHSHAFQPVHRETLYASMKSPVVMTTIKKSGTPFGSYSGSLIWRARNRATACASNNPSLLIFAGDTRYSTISRCAPPSAPSRSKPELPCAAHENFSRRATCPGRTRFAARLMTALSSSPSSFISGGMRTASSATARDRNGYLTSTAFAMAIRSP